MTTLPRIKVVDRGYGGGGMFVDTSTDKRWKYIGANLVRLCQDDPDKEYGVGGDHCLLHTDSYSSIRPGLVHRIKWLASQGYNVIRFFIGHWGQPGSMADGNPLNEGVLDNLADLIELAASYGMYSNVITDYLPNNEYFTSFAEARATDKRFFEHPSGLNYNAFHLCHGHISAKKHYVYLVMEGLIKRKGKEFLNNVVLWSLDNEAHFRTNQYPFTGADQPFTLNGVAFNLRVGEERRALAEFGAACYAGNISSAFRTMDHECLTTIGIYMPRDGVDKDGMWSDTVPGEYRRPFHMPSATAFGGVDVADLHVYPKKRPGWSMAADMAKVEFQHIQGPVIAGEFGLYKHIEPDPYEAGLLGQDFLRDAIGNYGFQGAAWWTADTPQKNSWSLIDPNFDGKNRGYLNYLLNPLLRPELWGIE